MISVTCGHCQARLEIPDQYAGQAGKCNMCGGAILVPVPPTAGFTPNPPPVPVKKNESRVPKTFLVVFGVLFLMAIIVALSPEPTPEEVAARQAQVESQKVEAEEARAAKEAAKAEQYAKDHPPLTQAHIDAAMDAIRAAGLPLPESIELTDSGYVTVMLQLDEIPSAASWEAFATDYTLAVRNAIYVMSDASDQWNYRVSIHGPSPGPGLVSIIGTARMSHYDGSISWKKGQP